MLPDLSDPASRPLEEQMPPQVTATPADVAPLADGEEPNWWRPSWSEILASVGWRWLLLTPFLGVVVIWAASWYIPLPPNVLWLVQAKILLFGCAVAVAIVGYLVRKMVRARREPFCIYCGYELTGLPDEYRCPECGRPYTWRLIAEYRRDPQWFIERWRMSRNLPSDGAPISAGAISRKRPNRDGTE